MLQQAWRCGSVEHTQYTNLWRNPQFFFHRLKAAGIECKTYGCGSTPSCSMPIDKMSCLTEFHPGNYVFYGECYCFQRLCSSTHKWFEQKKKRNNNLPACIYNLLVDERNLLRLFYHLQHCTRV